MMWILLWYTSCTFFLFLPYLEHFFLDFINNTDHYVMIHSLYWSSTDGAMGPARLHFDSPKFVSC